MEGEQAGWPGTPKRGQHKFSTRTRAAPQLGHRDALGRQGSLFNKRVFLWDLLLRDDPPHDRYVEGMALCVEGGPPVGDRSLDGGSGWFSEQPCNLECPCGMKSRTHFTQRPSGFDSAASEGSVLCLLI